MTTYFSGGESAIPYVEPGIEIEPLYKIDTHDESRVMLKLPGYKTNFRLNEGDTFFEHNNLLYIRTRKGDIISGKNYKWDNSLVREVFSQFEKFFGSIVQAAQIDSHNKLLGI